MWKIILILLFLSFPESLSAILIDGINYKFYWSGSKQVACVASYNNIVGDVVLPEKVSYNGEDCIVVGIESYAFVNCKDLNSIEISQYVKTIGDMAFYGCSNLSNLKIGERVTEIKESAFEKCSNLLSLSIPKSVELIENDAFQGCSNINEIVFEDGETPLNIKADAFYETEMTKLYLGRNYNFEGFHPPFYNKTALQKLTIGAEVTNISSYSFSDCTRLQDIEILDGRKTLIFDENVFIRTSITKMYLGRNFLYKGKFYESPFYEKSTLQDVVVGDYVTSIPPHAFDYCSISSITLGSSVEYIRDFAFRGCSYILSLSFPDSLKYIGEEAFIGCSSIILLELPISLDTIGRNAFKYCRDLTSLSLPSSIRSIGSETFGACENIKNVYYQISNKNPINGDKSIFPQDTYTNATLYVPAEAVDKCKQIEPWKYFSKIETYDFSGIDDVSVDLDNTTPCEVYNLNGVMIGNSIDNLAPGIYVVRQGNMVKKIAVK